MTLKKQITYAIWLLKVQNALPGYLMANVPEDIFIKRMLNTLGNISLKSAAAEIVGQLTPDVIWELSDVPRKELINSLSHAVAKDLAEAALEIWTRKLMNMFFEKLPEEIDPYFEKLSPEVMAQALAKKMADHLKNNTPLGSETEVLARVDRMCKITVEIATIATDMVLESAITIRTTPASQGRQKEADNDDL